MPGDARSRDIVRPSWLRANAALTRRLPPALAIGLGLAATDPALAGRIRAAQVSAIVRLTPATMIASSLNAAILVATLGHVGGLHASVLAWAGAVFVLTGRYLRVWARRTRRDPSRPASPRAIRAAIVNGALFGAVWGLAPAIAFPGAPLPAQMLVAGLTVGMMCAGASALATVPWAGLAYVGMMAAGSAYALLSEGTAACIGLFALMIVYTVFMAANLAWSANLFVGHFLSEARLLDEIAAREQAQTQMAHAQRMTALGELAGGVAHDFNNVLQAVSGTAGLIAQCGDDGPRVRKLSRVILDAAERGGSISRRMLASARQDIGRPEPVDVARVLADAAELLAYTMPAAIALRVEPADALPPVLADRALLETVLLNLAGNARDAMPDGGTLTLAAAIMPNEREPAAAPAGGYVRIWVADTGSGMDEATLARVTEPFFTTKPKGKGTGLGLSMAKGFAEQSGGGLAIASEPGRGTTVTLWLPEAAAAIEPASAAPENHGGRVLVVDDDDLVRETMMAALENAGFAILGAGGGAAALDWIDGGQAIDALVTDFSMPEMNGVELIDAARARRPGLPAILLTGHIGDVAAPPDDRAGASAFVVLQKPVRASEVARCLSDALRRTAEKLA